MSSLPQRNFPKPRQGNAKTLLAVLGHFGQQFPVRLIAAVEIHSKWYCHQINILRHVLRLVPHGVLLLRPFLYQRSCRLRKHNFALAFVPPWGMNERQHYPRMWRLTRPSRMPKSQISDDDGAFGYRGLYRRCKTSSFFQQTLLYGEPRGWLSWLLDFGLLVRVAAIRVRSQPQLRRSILHGRVR